MDSLQSRVCVPGVVLVVLFSITAILLNCLLLILLWRDTTKSLRSTAMVYIACLSVFHVLYGACAGTAAAESYIACALGANVSPHLERSFSRIFVTFFIRAENFFILAFAVERLGNTAFPNFTQRGSNATKNALLCIGCILLFSLSFSVCDKFAGKFWFRRLDVHLNCIVPLIVTVVLTYFLRRSLQNLSASSAKNDNSGAGFLQERTEESFKRNMKKQMPVGRAFLVIASLYTVSVITYFLFSLCEVYCSDCWKKEWFFAALRFSIVILFILPAASPLVSFVFIPKFQAGLKEVFCGKHEEQGIDTENVKLKNNKLGTVPVIYL